MSPLLYLKILMLGMLAVPLPLAFSVTFLVTFSDWPLTVAVLVTSNVPVLMTLA